MKVRANSDLDLQAEQIKQKYYQDTILDGAATQQSRVPTERPTTDHSQFDKTFDRVDSQKSGATKTDDGQKRLHLESQKLRFDDLTSGQRQNQAKIEVQDHPHKAHHKSKPPTENANAAWQQELSRANQPEEATIVQGSEIRTENTADYKTAQAGDAQKFVERNAYSSAVTKSEPLSYIRFAQSTIFLHA